MRKLQWKFFVVLRYVSLKVLPLIHIQHIPFFHIAYHKCVYSLYYSFLLRVHIIWFYTFVCLFFDAVLQIANDAGFWFYTSDPIRTWFWQRNNFFLIKIKHEVICCVDFDVFIETNHKSNWWSLWKCFGANQHVYYWFCATIKSINFGGDVEIIRYP